MNNRIPNRRAIVREETDKERRKALHRLHQRMEREAREHASFVHNFMHMVSQRQGDPERAPELDYRTVTREERQAIKEALELHDEDYEDDERFDTSCL